MDKYSDLLARCKKGDAQAQRILYDLFKGKLMGLCRRYTKSREEAKDILQESFISIFRNVHQLESADKLESWMKSIAVNTSINHYHRIKKHDVLIPLERTDALGPTQEQLADMSDEFLIRVINDLPDGCRVIFNLFVVEGYNHSEIAVLLKITEGTSRSQLHYAKALLKEKLKCQNLAHYYEKFA